MTAATFDELLAALPAFALDVGLRALLLCAVGIGVAGVLLRRRAVQASLVWNACGVALAVLPLFALSLPPLDVALLPPREEATPPAVSSAATTTDLPLASIPLDAAAEDAGADAGPTTMAAGSVEFTGSASPTVTHARPVDWSAIGGAAYGVVAALFLAHIIAGFRGLARLRGSVRDLTDDRWVRAFEHWRGRLGVVRRVRLGTSDAVSVPVAFGWLSPLIIIPRHLVSRVKRLQRDSVLAHELAHIRRGDFSWNVLFRLLRVVYWLHPLVWIVARLQERTREAACDEHCVHLLRGPRAYRAALVDVARHLVEPPPERLGLTMARPREFLRRIRRIDAGARSLVCVPRRSLRLVVGLIFVGLSGVVASVRLTRAKGVDDDPPEPIVVTVLDRSTRRPIRAARVEIRDGDDAIFRSTDARGRAAFPAVRMTTGRLHACVEADGFVPLRARWRVTSADAVVPRQHAFELERASSLGGVVLDPDGVPVAEASIRISVDASGVGGRVLIGGEVARTDASGRWRAAGLPGRMDRAAIEVAHAGFLPRTLSFQSAPIDVVGRGVASLWLERGLEVSGRVVDREGNPISGASVGASHEHGAYLDRTPRATTSVDGSFTLGGLRPGGTSLVAEEPGHAPSQIWIVVHESTAPCEIVLGPGRPLRIRVVDATDRPIAGAHVSVAQWDRVVPWDWSWSTASDGRVIWRNAPTGALVLAASRTGHARVTRHEVVDANEQVLRLGPALRIAGSVVDSTTGRPIDRFRVRTGARFGSSGGIHWLDDEAPEFRGGVYEVSWDSPRESTYLRIESIGFRPLVSRGYEPDEGSRVWSARLDAAPAVEGRVVSADGAPVAGAKIHVAAGVERLQVTNGAVRSRGSTDAVTSDDRGQFRLLAQTEEFTVLALHSSGFALTASSPSDRFVTLALVPWSRAEGVLRRGATTLPGAAVEIDAWSGPSTSRERVHFTARVETDGEGRFVADRLAAGEYRAGHPSREGGASGCGPLQAMFEVAAGGAAYVAVGGSGHTVVGRLVSRFDDVDFRSAKLVVRRDLELPRPRPRAVAEFDAWAAWYRDWVETDEGRAHRRSQWVAEVPVAVDGSFRIDDVPAGRFQLTSRVPGPLTIHPFVELFVPGPDVGEATIAFVVPDARPESPSDSTRANELDLGALELSPNPWLDAGPTLRALRARSIDGAPFDLANLRGRHVLVELHRAPCDPCAQRSRVLDRLRTGLADDDRVAFIRLDLTEPTASLTALADDASRIVPVDDEERRRLLDALPPFGLPPLVLLDPDGAVVSSDVGIVDVAAVLADRLESAP